ncbi:flagellar M-ring protein FliF [Clostridium sp. SYSU_GA19001]|uniref:flagellar basal-body MS-ring/collar protein FliF n=1 Tax=Clostridium caldaquaticum TaxID=2940653 RepID=UPI002076E0D8|nr:flagellar basal-body MS-ring/collar protein FliF [Clostridium caldaquaticum]MCM8710969.1 flagellar M-ring protein FliF [Clostridium caldaquaticum]
MGKLSEIFKSSYEKWKNISKGKKIALSVSFLGALIAIIYLAVSLGATKYDVLFSDLDATDANIIIEKLKEQKIENYKISGNTIMVPEEMRDKLRLELAPQITSGSKGWELFDSSNAFGSTDTETKIQYQRALQGELEKTIKSFSQVDKARVALVMPEDSVFVKDSSPASASITLMMKPGQSLTQEQVKAIVALVSGSVKNLPRENIQVIDDKMQLLTQGLFDNDSADTGIAAEKQQQMKKNYEKELENKVLDQLSKPFKNKVTVKINADLDFDAVQNVTNTIDPKGNKVSEKYIRDTNGNTTTRPSQSPVDNNMTNNTTTQNSTNTENVTYQEETINYEYGKSETKTVKALGSVKRITASVIIDGNLDDTTKNQITSLVAGAIGFNENRGDIINVEGIKFDSTDADNAKKALEEMEAQQAEEKKLNQYKLIGAGAGLLGLLILIIVIFIRRKKGSSKVEEQLEAMSSPQGINVLIGDDEKQPKVQFKPIDFDMEENNEKLHIEKEIKRYAAEKPDQVADIIKSWLAEDERW